MKKASDIVIQHHRPKEVCRKLAGENWEELYQESWLAVRENELKGVDIKDPISFFYKIALYKSKHRRTNIKNQVKLVYSDQVDVYERYKEIEYFTEEDQDKIETIEKTINKYLERKPENMVDKFYQDFCRALLKFNSIREAQKEMDICRTTFWIILTQLQEDLRNEHNTV